MNLLAPGIDVNGVKITPDEINAEVQYHPAENLSSAKFQAMRALVVRELLIQRAAELGLCGRADAIKNPDPIIEELLRQEITLPEADAQTYQRYYESNRQNFFTSPRLEVSHILYLAPPNDEKAREVALEKAQKALRQLKKNPTDFAKLAREESSCSSASESGFLGVISRGQTTPGFETALFKMHEGEMSLEPVASEVGYHIIKVHKRVEGEEIPFENVREWIAKELQSKSWQRAFHQYIQLLAGRSKISGFRFEGGAATPLVQ